MATRPDDPTIDVLTAVTNAATVPVSLERDRFAPGAIVAGRYRLVSLLGRGGMGEVYRADDLTLDQPPMLGYPAPRPTFGFAALALSGFGPLVFVWIAWVISALEGALITVLIIVILRLVLRRISLALIVTTLLVSVAFMQYMRDTGILGLGFPLVDGAVFTLIAFRFGLLPLVITRVMHSFVLRIPMVLDVSGWASAPALWTIAALLGLTIWAFVASRSGQPLFGGWLDERSPARV